MRRLLNKWLGHRTAGNSVTNSAADRVKADRLIAQGNRLEDQGQFTQAEALYREAGQLAPDWARVWLNLGNILSAQQQTNAAVASYRQALRWEPDYGAAHANLGKLHLDQKSYLNAAEHYAAATRLMPDSADAWAGLGCALEDLERQAEALEAYQNALAIQPDCVGLKLNLARVLKRLNRLNEAADYLLELLESEPDQAFGLVSLGGIMCQLGFIPEAVNHIRRAAQLEPKEPNIPSILLFAMNYLPDCAPVDLFAAHLDNSQRFYAQFYPDHPRHAPVPDPERRLRVGYVSGDFRGHPIGHPVSRFVEPLFIHHDRNHFVVHGFYNHRSADSITERLKDLADGWHPICDMKDDEVFGLIEQLGIDILIDLSGHTEYHRLPVFARKPAPVQATWLGYLGTTGLATMDYRICDAYTDPPGLTEHLHTETLARLPDSQWCHLPYGNPPPIGDLPLQRNGFLTLGSFNTPAKLNDQVLTLWARVLRSIPESRLRIAAIPSGRAQQRIVSVMEHIGMDSARIEFTARLPYEQYLASIAEVDMALDPFPYNGGTTSIDILMMGVPLVTLAGDHSIARGGVSILSNVGLPELIASNPEAYIKMVKRLASDVSGLAALRLRLRQQLQHSPLMDVARFTRNLEQLYRQMWRAWCARANGQSAEFTGR